MANSQNSQADISKYNIYHLHELEAALKDLDATRNADEVDEIKRLIASGGYQYPTDDVKGKRPFIITLLVIIGIVGGVISIPLVNSSHAQQIGLWYQWFLSLGILMALVCHIGFWLMRKWSIYLYIGFIAAAQMILVKMNLWIPQSLIEPLIVSIIVLSYRSRMK